MWTQACSSGVNAAEAGLQPQSETSEKDALTGLLPAAVYDRQLYMGEAPAVLSSCPEVGWLVDCLCLTPLPPGWQKSREAPGDAPQYVCETSGKVYNVPPQFLYFVRLAGSVIYARLFAKETKPWAHAVLKELKSLLAGPQKAWSGPHRDPISGDQFYSCLRTGVSSRENPCTWAVFVAQVVETLLKPLPIQAAFVYCAVARTFFLTY